MTACVGAWLIVAGVGVDGFVGDAVGPVPGVPGGWADTFAGAMEGCPEVAAVA